VISHWEECERSAKIAGCINSSGGFTDFSGYNAFWPPTAFIFERPGPD
jgi:hypothetical protein